MVELVAIPYQQPNQVEGTVWKQLCHGLFPLIKLIQGTRFRIHLSRQETRRLNNLPGWPRWPRQPTRPVCQSWLGQVHRSVFTARDRHSNVLFDDRGWPERNWNSDVWGQKETSSFGQQDLSGMDTIAFVFKGCTTCHTLKQVKQNATNNLALFFKSAFNALSDGVLRFAHCVAT